MPETIVKEKPQLHSNFFRGILCKLGLHRWESIYTHYAFDPNYKIDWNQYCLYCPVERENPLHGRG